jgi:hypothetical protein
MNFSNNPQAVYNGNMSGQRNMFLSSSLAAVMIGFSSKFENKTRALFVKLLGALIFFISIYIGFSTNYDFRFYLDKMKGELPDYIPVENWYNWTLVVYTYTIIIFVIGSLFLFKNFLPFKF